MQAWMSRLGYKRSEKAKDKDRPDISINDVILVVYNGLVN